jgi:hypothetical protein
MQTQQTITLFGTVSNSATSRISKNGRKYTAFGVAIISDRNLQAFHYNVVAFGKQGHFAKPLQTGTRIKLVVQAQSQPDNIASIPLLTATFVRPVCPVARGIATETSDIESYKHDQTGGWLHIDPQSNFYDRQAQPITRENALEYAAHELSHIVADSSTVQSLNNGDKNNDQAISL